MMKITLNPPAKHHSTTDWDIGSANWELSASKYVSPPTSLRETIGGSVPFINKHPDCLLLTDGEIRSQGFWYDLPAGNEQHFLFRCQAAIGSASGDQYRAEFRWHGVVISLDLGIEYIAIGAFTWVPIIWTWYPVRLRWQTVDEPGHPDSLKIQLFIWLADEWVEQTPPVYDDLNRFKDSAINRAGIRVGKRNHWDDTELWRKT